MVLSSSSYCAQNNMEISLLQDRIKKERIQLNNGLVRICCLEIEVEDTSWWAMEVLFIGV